MKWYRTYNKNGYFTNRRKPNGRALLPTLLNSNPDLYKAVKKYCIENLSTLTGESLHDYIATRCLPNIRCEETTNPTMTMKELLQENGLKTFH